MKKRNLKLISYILVFLFVVTTFGVRETKALNVLTHPVPEIDTTNGGYNIQKFMHLLETSTEENRNTAKIVFYGQSISDPNNTWPVMLTNYLKEKYPYANIQYTNLAIGGYTTELLSRMIADDMKGLNPDLVVLYDYGSKVLYEKMVRYLRTNTTAEIMVQASHYTKEDLGADTTSYEFLPSLVDKYNVELCQIRTPWKEYIDQYYSGDPKVLLSDDVHLNELGQEFMFELMKQFFVYREPDSNWESPVKDYIVGKDVNWKDGELELTFEGNRVELIADKGEGGTIQVSVDGKKPSEILACYTNPRIWRPNGIWSGGAHLLRAVPLKVPGEETWTFKWTEFKEEFGSRSFEYTVEGSKTGPDGQGDGYSTFVSKSNQWAIFPEDFCFHTTPSPNVTQYTWDPILNGTDTFNIPTQLDEDKENITLLAAGLSNGKHELKLVKSDSSDTGVKAIRVYQPTMKEAKLTKPKFGKINSSTYFTKGKTQPDSIVVLTAGAKKYITEADANGKYVLDFKAQKPGQTLKIRALRHGIYGPVAKTKVGALKPKVSKIKVKNKKIKGKTYKNAKVFVKIAGKKVRKIKANKKGKFSLRVKKLKRNSKVRVWVSINGVKSKKRVVKVK